jgi:hypothetical protein
MKTRLVPLAALLVAAPAIAQQGTPPATTPPQPDMSADNGFGHQMPGHDMSGHDMSAHIMAAALGPWGMTREASGTAWQPDTTPMFGLHRTAGDWSMMGHALLNLACTHQSGPRGDDKLFLAGMVMGMAARDLGDRTRLQFRAMLSPEPAMGSRGYPLLLAAGETADGLAPLIDRQHPHELFMELSASLSVRLGARGSAFLYVGLPGEPAFGPPAFMHRQSTMDSPEAPISHHWLDSTHISFGVITAGVAHDNLKLEASRFKGREPDEHRWDIDTPKFDSTSVRLSWNPTRTLALQASWANLRSPEQLAPEEDQTRWSASAIHTVPRANGGWWATTLAWGRKQGRHHGEREPASDAFVAETALNLADRWTLFGRAERIETDELLPEPGEIHGETFAVGRISAGAIRDLQLAPGVKLGLGAIAARSFAPAGLRESYGGNRWSGWGFLRLKVG